MHIGVTYAASFGFNQYLAGSGRGDFDFPYHQGLTEMLNDGRLHFMSHLI